MHLLASEEYGLRCLVHVAAHGAREPVSIGAIAAAEGLSPEYTAKLMRRLRLGELVTSVLGAGGGYLLARPAHAISVWSALRVLGGELFAEGFCECYPGLRRECVRNSDCAIRALWRGVQAQIRETLERTSLADLRRDERAMTTWLGAADASQAHPEDRI
ncbi:MAG: Rrf2 family transcriptional regulator [Myxococcota bacterium]